MRRFQLCLSSLLSLVSFLSLLPLFPCLLLPLHQLRLGRAQVVSVAGAGENQIQYRQRLDGLADIGRLVSHQVAQFSQQPAHFLFLVHLQLAPLVVQLDRAERLDEKRRAAGGLVVDQPADAALEFRL